MSEEVLYKQIPIDPIEAVAIQGLAGVVYATVVILIASYMFGIESTGEAVDQMMDNKILSALIGGQLIAVAVSGYFGNCLTKLVSSMARSTTNSVRTVVVWAVCLILGWEDFIFLQFVGYSITTYGVLSYNGILSAMKKEIDNEKTDEKLLPLEEVKTEK